LRSRREAGAEKLRPPPPHLPKHPISLPLKVRTILLRSPRASEEEERPSLTSSSDVVGIFFGRIPPLSSLSQDLDPLENLIQLAAYRHTSWHISSHRHDLLKVAAPPPQKLEVAAATPQKLEVAAATPPPQKIVSQLQSQIQ
jgi:hypothetical protein